MTSQKMADRLARATGNGSSATVATAADGVEFVRSLLDSDGGFAIHLSRIKSTGERVKFDANVQSDNGSPPITGLFYMPAEAKSVDIYVVPNF